MALLNAKQRGGRASSIVGPFFLVVEMGKHKKEERGQVIKPAKTIQMNGLQAPEEDFVRSRGVSVHCNGRSK